MRSLNKNKILKILKETPIPLSIDAVRFRAGLSDWNVTKAILLELLSEGKIHGLKSSKSWIFWYGDLGGKFRKKDE